MTIYSISGFSFNIGSTTISQEYVPLVKEDVPWGINSTYIYKARTLRDQFNVINKHLVIENKCVGGNIIFKTQGTEKIIITDLSVGTINGLPYSGSGSGVGLTENSVNSSHIINGSILGTDISEGTITSYNILDGTILGTDISSNTIGLENLDQQFKDELYTIANPTGLITITNNGLSTTWFKFKAYYLDLSNNEHIFYDSPNKIGIGTAHHCLYTSNMFLYGANPVLRIKITNASVTRRTILQGAKLLNESIVAGEYIINFEEVYYNNVKNMVLDIEV